MARLLLVLLLAASPTLAQLSVPGVVTPDAVVAGILEQPSALDEGPTIRASGHLRVVRVIAGDVAAGARLPLRWEYRASPNEPREAEKHFPAGPGLWILARDGETWKPQRFVTDFSTQFAGGYVYPLPGEQIPAQYWTELDARWERKLAHEVWWSLEQLAQQHGQALNPARKVLPNGAIWVRPTPAQRHFQAGSFLIWSAPESETLHIYHRLAESPYPNVRTPGFTGLLRAGVAGAAREMEKDWPLLAPTLEAIRISHGFRGIARLPKEDVFALARLALAEVVPPFFEAAVAGQLAPLGLEALPFTAAFLQNPDARVSGAAVATACLLLKETVDSPQRWCAVRQSRTEPEVIAFWQDRMRDLDIQQRMLPGRYGLPGPNLPADVEIPVEERLWRVALFASRPDTLPWKPPLSGRDREILLPVLDRLRREYERHVDAHSAMMHDRRRQGLPWDASLNDELKRKVKASRLAVLEQLRRELSSEGWTALEGVLQSMPATRPAPPLFQ
jgi:hypothetical protein